jgi:hypothetical protein
MKKKTINKRYIPKHLSKKDKKKQYQMLNKSKKLYTKGKYYNRRNISSFKSKKSNHIQNAKKMYNINSIEPSKELSLKTGCSLQSLKKIVSKGQGAYFSSGSRPNQTAQSWGIARLASAITGGKAGAVDYNILLSGCKPKSKGRKMAEKSKKIYRYGKRKVAKNSVY